MKTSSEARTRWVPIYHTLFEHEQVLRMRGILKLPRLHVVGMVARTYAWLADRVGDSNRDQLDAVIAVEDPAFVFDDLVDHPGFFAAMCRVEWFVWDEANGTMRVRNYFEKNGTLALKRAADQARQVKQRRRGEEPRPGEEPGLIELSGSETVMEGGQKRDTSVTGPRSNADKSVTTPFQDRDQQKQEHENNQPTSPDTSVRGQSIVQPTELVGWLVEQGIRMQVAERLAASMPAPVLLTAGKMAVIARQQGWKGNVAGYLINRVNDGSAAAAVSEKQVGDDAIAAKEWARRFLAGDAAAQQAVFAGAVERKPGLERVGAKSVLAALPNEAMLALGAVLADRVERGDMDGRDVAPAFTAFVTRIGGGA